jgi:hypothetical protein
VIVNNICTSFFVTERKWFSLNILEKNVSCKIKIKNMCTVFIQFFWKACTRSNCCSRYFGQLSYKVAAWQYINSGSLLRESCHGFEIQNLSWSGGKPAPGFGFDNGDETLEGGRLFDLIELSACRSSFVGCGPRKWHASCAVYSITSNWSSNCTVFVGPRTVQKRVYGWIPAEIQSEGRDPYALGWSR